MKIRLPLIIVILITIFVLLTFYISLFKNNNYIPKKVNNKIENISFEEFYSGDSLNLKNLFNEESLIVINIWASWCIPCRQEHEYITNLSKIENIKLIGLNYKDKKNNAKNFIIKYGNPYHFILTDPEGIISIDLGAYGVPETLIIKNKKIVKKYIGPLNEKILKEINEIVQ